MTDKEHGVFDKIFVSIDKKDFINAEQKLNDIINAKKLSEEAISYSHYLIGYIHTRWDNNGKNRRIAKRQLLSCINSDYPYPHAYALYAGEVDDKNTALNYLKSGLEKFPMSPSIYLGLLRYSSKDEKAIYIYEIIEKSILDKKLLNNAVEFLIENEKWEDAEKALQILFHLDDLNVDERLYCRLLFAFSKIEQGKDTQEATSIFESLISEDLSHSLCYAPYMGAIQGYITSAQNDKAIALFKIVPIDALDDLIANPWNVINIDFSKIYAKIFKALRNILKPDKGLLMNLNALEAYYLYIPSETYDIHRYSKKHLSALKAYWNNNLQNLSTACAIYNMQLNFHQYFDAYITYKKMLCNYLKPNEKFIEGVSFFDDCTQEETDKILEDIINTLQSDIDIDLSKFVLEICDPLIEHLFEENSNGRSKIVLIANQMSDHNFTFSQCLFEIAYSYAEKDAGSLKAEKLYLELLKKNPQNDSVLNNLGVIYENKGNLDKAMEYFEQANNIDSDDEIHSRNLERVKKALSTSQKLLDIVKKEDIWFLTRLNMIAEITDQNNEFECRNRERASLLSVSPQKAEEVFEKMLQLKYIEKTFSGNYNTPSKYRLNAIIRDYLIKENARIAANKTYELIGEKLNIDELNRIGYTQEIKDKINTISNSDLRDILYRDVHEGAVSLIACQNKSCIVLCGSIIEALLVYKIEECSFKNYDIGTLLGKAPKMKIVKELDLAELVEIAKKENIISAETYHLASYARLFRNIIHPSCEIRKSYDISDDKAKTIWNAMLSIVKENL